MLKLKTASNELCLNSFLNLHCYPILYKRSTKTHVLNIISFSVSFNKTETIINILTAKQPQFGLDNQYSLKTNNFFIISLLFVLFQFLKRKVIIALCPLLSSFEIKSVKIRTPVIFNNLGHITKFK